MPITPTFFIEHEYWSQGVGHIAGIDEAGMGALAGPVVAGAVIFSESALEKILEHSNKIPIRDSKLLSEKQREKAFEFITELADSYSIGEASVEEIDALNIRNASHLAMRRAIENLSPEPDMLLIDGTSNTIHPTIFSLSVVKGDQLSYSIAAGSILAKVTRDRIMKQLDPTHPEYGFISHKGYGAKQHLDALAKYGVTPHHRKSYAPIARLLTKEAA
ncbi:MAG TPA: ribonuclease HII [Candidatus Andersenbacteria bacterium]|nr:ribonuclease HII [Candidatus Andersenbacteria bacterium]